MRAAVEPALARQIKELVEHERRVIGNDDGPVPAREGDRAGSATDDPEDTPCQGPCAKRDL